MKRLRQFHSNLVWPPVLLVVTFAIAYGMLAGGLWFIGWSASIPGGGVADREEFKIFYSAVVGGAAGFYAIYRVLRFHPASNSAYAEWLRSSPWNADKPLPLGPIHLVWQDAAVIGVLALIAVWHAHVDPMLPAIVFGLVYLAVLTFSLLFTRAWAYCVILGFLWPAMILPAVKGPAMIGLVAALIIVIVRGQQASLRAFPWAREDPKRPGAPRAASPRTLLQTDINLDPLSPSRINANVGWPFQRLAPKFPRKPIAISTCFWVSALIGWWLYCAILGFEMDSVPEPILVFGIAAALVRLVIYCGGLAPSFNLWGRIAYGRMIVPGFDQVFVVPLTVVITAILSVAIIHRCGGWFPSATALAVAMVWFLLLAGGPTLRSWNLTGHHRYSSSLRSNANRQLLKQV